MTEAAKISEPPFVPEFTPGETVYVKLGGGPNFDRPLVVIACHEDGITDVWDGVHCVSNGAAAFHTAILTRAKPSRLYTRPFVLRLLWLAVAFLAGLVAAPTVHGLLSVLRAML